MRNDEKLASGLITFLLNLQSIESEFCLLLLTIRTSLLLYEAGVIKSETGVIFLQPLGTGHATIPHIKAMDVPFHMGYGGLICSMALQSDRPK